MESLETYLRLAVNFVGRTAYQVSEYDGKLLNFLVSATHHARNLKRGKITENENSQKLASFINQTNVIIEEEQDKNEYDIMKQIVQAAEIVAYGGKQESNLGMYSYDMVFAATLGSVNATMKEYIDKASAVSEPQTLYFMERIDGQSVLYEKATEEETRKLEALNLFEISDDPNKRTEKQKENLNLAYELFLSFAFKAVIGFPEGKMVDDIIDFNTGETGNHTKVKYNLYFREFSIIQFLPTRREGYIFNNYTQDNNLWAFKFTADLSLIGVSLDTLPPEVKEKVNNIDPGQIFSISQLFLDLNEPQLLSLPTIEGLTPATMDVLSSKFVTFYFSYLRKHAGEAIIGYSIVPKSVSSSKPYLLKPRDFRFYISPYYENSQPVPAKKKLYTLNYIVICEDKTFPELRNITWNWVDEKQYQFMNGVVSISKGQIYKFAKEQYKLILQNILFNVIAEIKINDPIYIYWYLGVEKNHSATVEFTDNTFTYMQKKKDSDYFVPIWGNVELSYEVIGTIRNYQTADNKSILECRTDVKSFLHVNAVGGVSEGTVYDMTTWYTLTINVDQYGRLTLIPNIKEEKHNITFKISGWSKAMVCGLDDYLNDLKSDIGGAVTDNKEKWDNEFANRYNNNAAWYLPGDNSLLFKEPTFSNNSDLTFSANYATPTSNE